jgi:hypothetical protein
MERMMLYESDRLTPFNYNGHFSTLEEIAKNYRLKTLNGFLHSQFVSAYIHDYMEIMVIDVANNQYWYLTPKDKWIKVYLDKLYEPATEWSTNHIVRSTFYMSNKGRRFYILSNKNIKKFTNSELKQIENILITDHKARIIAIKDRNREKKGWIFNE